MVKGYANNSHNNCDVDADNKNSWTSTSSCPKQAHLNKLKQPARCHERYYDVLVKVKAKVKAQIIRLRHLWYYVLFLCLSPTYGLTELKAISYLTLDMLIPVSGLESLYKVLVCCDLGSDNCIPLWL